TGRTFAARFFIPRRDAGSGYGTSFPQRLRERPGVHVFELAAHRHAASQSCHLEPARCEQLADVVRRRLALVGEIGGEHDLADETVGRPLDETLEADFLGPN